MPRIFISYRRDDTRAISGRIYDRLAEAFGKENIFKDVDKIPPGSSFAEVLENELKKCNILLIIIGQKWVNITDAEGKKRLDNPEDFVRIEVERGLSRPDLLVIPVLVDEAGVPNPADLPDSLGKIASLQVVQVRHDPDFHRDMNRLIDFLKVIREREEVVQRREQKATRRILLGAGLAALIVVMGFVGLVMGGVIRLPGQGAATIDPVEAAFLLLTKTKEAEVAALATATPNLTATIDAILTNFVVGTDTAQTATAAAYTDTPTATATPSDTPTATDSPTPTATETPNFTETANAQAANTAQAVNNAQATLNAQATNDALGTRNAPTNTPQPTETPTRTPSPTATHTPQPTETPTRTLTTTASPSATPTATPTTNLTAAAQALRDAQATLDVQTTMTEAAQLTQAALTPAATLAPLGMIVSSQSINMRSVPSIGNNVVAVLPPGTQVTVLALVGDGAWYQVRLSDGRTGYIASTLVSIIGTPTITPIPDPTIAALMQIEVTHNADWQPYSQTFDGVEMVLVPAGCFMMGSENGAADEKPVHQQCFDAPFWIDRTEVTQADFARLGGQANPNYLIGDDLPIGGITWFEARDFCALRRMRLPTEAEWEYAARGPDNLVYPWGNEFVLDNVVFDVIHLTPTPLPITIPIGSGAATLTAIASSEAATLTAVDSRRTVTQVANVGNRPGGASWVGALDMSGNVAEWVSSLWLDYPYRNYDGREDVANGTDFRVLRGGSWFSFDDSLRAADRYEGDPAFRYGGFRCARDFWAQ
ncbi:MAG: SUMF1/EgtB/PvdO family nonheme iron enzyme [Anaerolineae bacterium]|nr:SUMF1/EgtB/PvdO family nonheme iron enzyme [Anaerolineae bacterium]